MAVDIFACAVTTPEAKAVVTCLRKSCERDVSLNELDAYLLWPRVIAIAVKTVPLVGSKAAGVYDQL